MGLPVLAYTSITKTRQRFSDFRSDPIASNSSLMMLNGLMTSAFGYVFWVIATHVFSASDVGLANATIAAAALVATASDLGMRSLVMSTLPKLRSITAWSAQVSTSIFVTGIASTAGVAILFGVLDLIHSPISSEFDTIWIAVFLLFAITQCWNLLLDGILCAERLSSQMVQRNFLLSILKIIMISLIALTTVRSGQAIVAAAVMGTTVAAAFGFAHQLRAARAGWNFTLGGLSTSLQTMRSKVLGHHALTLAGYLPLYFTPILVVSLLGTSENAYLSLSWTIGSVFFMISPAVGSMLFVQGRWEPHTLRRALTKSIRMVAVLLIPAGVAAVLFGHYALSWFGKEYADKGYVVLCILAISAVPDAVTNLFTGLLRATDRVNEAAAMNVLISLSAIGFSWLCLVHFGIAGAALGWLIAQSIGCVWVLFSSLIASPLARPRRAPAHARLRS